MYTIFFIIAVVVGVIIALAAHSDKGKNKDKKDRSRKDNAMSDEDMLATALWEDDIDLFKDK